MSGIANGEPASGREKSGDDGGGESSVAGECGELLVEQANEFFLIEAVHEAAHQGAQIGGGGCYGLAVAGNVGEQQTADASGGATGNVINIAAALRFAEWLAVNPDVEAAQLDAAGR